MMSLGRRERTPVLAPIEGIVSCSESSRAGLRFVGVGDTTGCCGGFRVGFGGTIGRDRARLSSGEDVGLEASADPVGCGEEGTCKGGGGGRGREGAGGWEEIGDDGTVAAVTVAETRGELGEDDCCGSVELLVLWSCEEAGCSVRIAPALACPGECLESDVFRCVVGGSKIAATFGLFLNRISCAWLTLFRVMTMRFAVVSGAIGTGTLFMNLTLRSSMAAALMISMWVQ